MKASDSIDRLRIASPCPVGWEKMSGDDRVRFCDQCSLHVYNLAELTRAEAEKLIANTEGRICARLFRRADGTIITKDCPVGLRAIRRRMAKRGAAIFAAVMTLATSVFGQKPKAKDKSSCREQVTTTRTVNDSTNGLGSLSGRVVDPNDATVAGVTVTIADQKTKQSRTTVSDKEGKFLMAGLETGTYTIGFQAIGFKKLELRNISLGEKESINIELILNGEATEVIGVVAAEPSLIDLPRGTFIINERMIRSLPIP